MWNETLYSLNGEAETQVGKGPFLRSPTGERNQLAPEPSLHLPFLKRGIDLMPMIPLLQDTFITARTGSHPIYKF